jgi:hypothetical protein
MANMTAAFIAAGIAARIEAMIQRSSLNATIAEMDRSRQLGWLHSAALRVSSRWITCFRLRPNKA